MVITPANRAVENGLSEQDCKKRRGDNPDSTIVIIGILIIMVAAISVAITVLMG
jgi:flagellar basal body-associated protein FliL